MNGREPIFRIVVWISMLIIYVIIVIGAYQMNIPFYKERNIYKVFYFTPTYLSGKCLEARGLSISSLLH